MRILIVDDEPVLHDAYRIAFAPRTGAAAPEADTDAAGLLPPVAFDCTHCHQGAEGVAVVEAAMAAGDPYAVAFIDVRMPPGIDGREVACRIRALDPAINLVMVTEAADFSSYDVARCAGPPDKLFYIAKPFELAEIVQAATALSSRWHVDRELDATRAELRRKVGQLEEQGLELAANEGRALYLATHDPLTEAPNRLAFTRALAGHCEGEHCFAAAMLDLDRFKLINDTLGHLVGDQLIRQVCDALQAALPPGGMVARLGGDEFGLLFPTPGAQAGAMTCDRLLLAVSRGFDVVGHSVHAGASVGVVVTPPNRLRDPVDILRRADLALNEAKQHGRGQVRTFDDRMDESIRLRGRIEEGLSAAIGRGELSLVYQPIVATADCEIVGFEALLRWNSPEYGNIAPGVFIPIAEESNLIHELGDWVIDQSLQVLAQWPGQYVSVNFSPRQFRRQNFVGYVMERVQRAGVDPRRMQIELTETAIFDDADRAAETLYRLRQMGFRIALDDFGTGYSSLYNIRKFALDSLKIDRSFIDGMGRERESAAIVQSIVQLGRALGLKVIAEGVETEVQLRALQLVGASHLQGYFFSRPVIEEAARTLAEQRHLDTIAVPVPVPALHRGDGTGG